MLTVYLAGAIRCHPDPVTWRKQATEILEQHGCRVLNPLANSGNADTPGPIPVTSDMSIVQADLDMIAEADVILAEMSRPDLPYIGTAMELVYARMYGKKVVVWGEPHQDSIWIRHHATMIYRTFIEALAAITEGTEPLQRGL